MANISIAKNKNYPGPIDHWNVTFNPNNDYSIAMTIAYNDIHEDAVQKLKNFIADAAGALYFLECKEEY